MGWGAALATSPAGSGDSGDITCQMPCGKKDTEQLGLFEAPWLKPLYSQGAVWKPFAWEAGGSLAVPVGVRWVIERTPCSCRGAIPSQRKGRRPGLGLGVSEGAPLLPAAAPADPPDLGPGSGSTPASPRQSPSVVWGRHP